MAGLLGRLTAGCLTVAISAAFGQPEPTADRFQSEIKPIFEQSCVKCHGPDMAMGKLRLDSEKAVLQGGATGPVVLKGKSTDSLLVKRILGVTDAPRMPMGADPLTPEKVALIRGWIDHGDFTAADSKEPAGSASVRRAPKTEANQSAVFATSIRPILAERCYGCHGPGLQQNGLRVDSLAALLKGSESGPIVVAGHADKSRLMRRLMAQERPQMPYGGPPLSADQIQTVRQWINAGAPGPDGTAPLPASKPLKHWSLVKPVTPPVPQVKEAAWCRNPIDNFVLARLEREGLKPSPEATKAALLRRVYLDLTGLPPSPAQLDAFLSDNSAGAYERVVDRLLASPHYGERWARPWLDLARYADSNGYEKDGLRVAWEYRDWVIRASNADMSFRDFTINQIAGDMLPHPTQDQLIATGFNRNSMLNQEGGIDVEEYYWLGLVDRVNTTASVWLGSTLACAQCHNHKFDPFTQKDYYKFLAFFGNGQYHVAGTDDRWTQEPELELPTPQQKKKSDELRSRIAQLEKVLGTDTPQLAAAQTAWEKEQQGIETMWHPLNPAKYSSAGGATLETQPDHSLLATGKNPQADTYTVETKTDLEHVSGLRLEVLPDPSLPQKGPGRDAEGNFFLSDLDVKVAPATNPEAKTSVVWKAAAADESQEGYEVKNLLHNEPGVRGWAIDHASGPISRQAIFLPEKTFGFAGGTLISITMKHEMRHATRNIGRFRLSLSTDLNPGMAAQVPAKLRPVLALSPEQRTPQQRDNLAAAYRKVAPSLEPERREMASLEEQLKKLGIVTAMTLSEKPEVSRPSTYLRERGSYLSKGDLVYAEVPSALNPLPKGAPPNRLGLAGMARERRQSAHVACRGQSHLGIDIRPRHRRD